MSRPIVPAGRKVELSTLEILMNLFTDAYDGGTHPFEPSEFDQLFSYR